MTEYLVLDDLLAIMAAAGDEAHIRDRGLLESALARPRASISGEDAYPTLAAKAAALLVSLVNNHALSDGNKRLGWVAVRVFFVLNDQDLAMPHDEAEDLVMSIAAGALVDVGRIAERFEPWLAEIGGSGTPHGAS